jgi:hypothetical protein
MRHAIATQLPAGILANRLRILLGKAGLKSKSKNTNHLIRILLGKRGLRVQEVEKKKKKSSKKYEKKNAYLYLFFFFFLEKQS